MKRACRKIFFYILICVFTCKRFRDVYFFVDFSLGMLDAWRQGVKYRNKHTTYVKLSYFECFLHFYIFEHFIYFCTFETHGKIHVLYACLVWKARARQQKFRRCVFAILSPRLFFFPTVRFPRSSRLFFIEGETRTISDTISRTRAYIYIYTYISLEIDCHSLSVSLIESEPRKTRNTAEKSALPELLSGHGEMYTVSRKLEK